MPNRTLLPFALLMIVPLTAGADDASWEQPPVQADEPVATPATVDPCDGVHRRSHWRGRGRLAVGFSKGHVDGDVEGTQKSFVARLNGRRGWAIELELSRLSLDGGEVARTGGAALVKTFGRRKLAPYVIGGAGGGRLDSGERLHFAELGGGVMLRGKRLSIGADVRRGVRRSDGEMSTARSISPVDDDARERYVRGRIVGMVTF